MNKRKAQGLLMKSSWSEAALQDIKSRPLEEAHDDAWVPEHDGEEACGDGVEEAPCGGDGEEQEPESGRDYGVKQELESRQCFLELELESGGDDCAGQHLEGGGDGDDGGGEEQQLGSGDGELEELDESGHSGQEQELEGGGGGDGDDDGGEEEQQHRSDRSGH